MTSNARRMYCRVCFRACVHYQFENGFNECRMCGKTWRRLVCTRCKYVTTRVVQVDVEYCGLCRSSWRVPALTPVQQTR